MVSDALPARLQDKALVTEPTAKLIGIMDIQAGRRRLQGDRWLQPSRQHRRMDVADLRRCRSRRRRLGDRFLQLHHSAQPDAEHPVGGHPGHDRSRRRLQDRERPARPNPRPHLSRRLEGRPEKFDQIPRQCETAELVAGARQWQPVLEPHRAAPDRGQQDEGCRSGAEKARDFRHRRQRRDSCALVARRHRRARQRHASESAARQRSRAPPQRDPRLARE